MSTTAYVRVHHEPHPDGPKWTADAKRVIADRNLLAAAVRTIYDQHGTPIARIVCPADPFGFRRRAS